MGRNRKTTRRSATGARKAYPLTSSRIADPRRIGRDPLPPPVPGEDAMDIPLRPGEGLFRRGVARQGGVDATLEDLRKLGVVRKDGPGARVVEDLSQDPEVRHLR